jgi:hypothetical protein
MILTVVESCQGNESRHLKSCFAGICLAIKKSYYGRTQVRYRRASKAMKTKILGSNSPTGFVVE